MKGFHPTLKHFRKTGVVGNIDDLQPAVLQVLGRASGGEQFDAEFCEAFGKVKQAGFVGNGKKGTGDGHGGRRDSGVRRERGEFLGGKREFMEAVVQSRFLKPRVISELMKRAGCARASAPRVFQVMQVSSSWQAASG
jgi:hypothetical protein